MTVKFTLKDLKNVFMDYRGDKVDKLHLNSKLISAEDITKQWVDGKLNFSESTLVKGENTV